MAKATEVVMFGSKRGIEENVGEKGTREITRREP